ncbi:BsuPI-related putative proteinase inhibitor [Gracilimonas sp.]|uniref:BsuPI-related putative proteinase inhibitor n=1 Tax=Gracilimonas sp. TaxID=1974203 RepID=UPI002870B8BF|nr:BsuPI-related putative proteinase inhibitor [Gracilimonas sp.]
MKKLLIGVLLILMSGCDLLSDSHSELSTSLELQNETIERLRDIEASFEILNNTGKKISFEFPSSCQFGFVISKGEEVIFDSSQEQACLTVVTSLDIKNGSRKVFEIDIPFQDELEPGTYEISAFLLEGYADPVSKTFTVD